VTKRKKGYWLLLSLTILLTLAALSTLLPTPGIHKACLLGYMAHCSFTPISTILCLLLAAVVCFTRKRLLR